MHKISVKTNKREEILEITDKVKNSFSKAKKQGISNGICRVFVPHTTAGVTINENADPAVEEDLISILHDLVPKKSSYKHREGNSDAHMKSSIMGSSVEVLVNENKLVLGTWQGIQFCEFDGPRNRNVYIQFMGE